MHLECLCCITDAKHEPLDEIAALYSVDAVPVAAGHVGEVERTGHFCDSVAYPIVDARLEECHAAKRAR